ncbi:hypothetical protein QWZ12_08905 [Methylobacterium adhaesivum]|uniref:Uncharacterized protein n=1 Tax=Methylobacterium adhaesivum TaxID=333297 RepID=A0ABT8BF29_9HYPH|nr:hypothetical protein [Methylobacterium adhaesivum]MDN3590732.1 hypothetical protein [Methylobacterium adhaesivum]
MNILDWFLRNRRTGEITIGQWPNASLTLFGLCAGIDWAFAPAGQAGTILRGVGTAALIVWAADELVRGVNPWRRLLGAGMLVALALRWLAGVSGRG